MAEPITQPSHDAASSNVQRRPPWALPVVIVAIAAIAVAFVFGVMGLTANPVKSTEAGGITTLQGSFEPYQCNASSCDGYVQAGARSVFIQLPQHCPEPSRGSTITVTARAAPDLGSGSYRAATCAR